MIPRVRRVVVATRSSAKLREIRAIAREVGDWEAVDLDSAGIPASGEEEGIEVFGSFDENARAKAAYFAARSAELVMADDSGLCVDALGGEPGVHSRRFAPPESGPRDPDVANNLHLLRRLAGVPPERRAAHYRCVVSLMQGGEELGRWTGRCDGVILEQPRGEGGFGYDPLFFVPELGATFGELDPQVKNRLSHRAAAVRAALRFLEERD